MRCSHGNVRQQTGRHFSGRQKPEEAEKCLSTAMMSQHFQTSDFQHKNISRYLRNQMSESISRLLPRDELQETKTIHRNIALMRIHTASSLASAFTAFLTGPQNPGFKTPVRKSHNIIDQNHFLSSSFFIKHASGRRPDFIRR